MYKTNMPVAVTNFSQHNLDSQHVTTADFMTFNVSKIMELAPNQTIDVKHSLFARLDAMPVPTFGRGKIHSRAFFVPFRTLTPIWNDMINDTPHVFDDGIESVTNVPVINMFNIVLLFVNNSELVSEATESDYDIKYVSYLVNSDTINDTRYRKFTPFGRNIYKLLRSLGYGFTFSSNFANTYDSALPLLAALRVYLDYYFPAAYENDSESSFIKSLFTYNGADVMRVGAFSQDDLIRIFRVLNRVCYDDDFFTSAWDYPDAPNNSSYSGFSINDIINDNSVDEERVVFGNGTEYGTDQGAKIVNVNNGAITSISQYSLDSLKALTDYLKRNQIVGSRNIDRYLARFGIKLQDEKLNRCEYIGDFTQDLTFGDVTSTADTDGAQLGSYAGKGLSFGQGHYSYQAYEFGFFVIISTIVPDSQYFEGVARHTMHLSKLDFFTPEFDNLGTQALSCREVYSPLDGSEVPGTLDYKEKIFGFVPRYAEYKTPYSQVTGDFTVRSLATGADSWTLFRSVKPFIDNVGGLANFVHDYQFVVGFDSSQFNRIFYNVDDSADHFRIIHDFNISSRFPGKSLYDTYDFKDEDKAKKVNMEVSGSTLN